MVKHSVSISGDVMMVIRIVQGHTAGQQQVQDAKPGLAFLPASITVELFYLCTLSVEGLVVVVHDKSHIIPYECHTKHDK